MAVTKRVLKNGNGADKPKNGDEVVVDYTGYLYDPTAKDFKGDKFDSTEKRGEFQTTIGIGKVIQEYTDNIEARNSNGQTPLAMACMHSPVNVEYIEAGQHVVRTLLEAGASMHSQDNEGFTPFQGATRDIGYSAGNVKVLVEHGADIHERDTAGRTALHHALSGSSNTDIATITYLMEQGADVNAIANDGIPPLHMAMRWHGALRGNPPPYKLLLWNGADPNARDSEGRVALQLSWDVDVWKPLLQTGARVDERDAEGRTTLHRLLSKPYDDYWGDRKRLSHVALLLAYKADANATDNNGYTPLMYTVQNPVVSEPGLTRYIMWILMHFGADPRIKSSQGCSAFDICANADVKKMLNELCKAPPRLNTDNRIFRQKPEEEEEDLLYLLGRLCLAI